MTFSFNLIDQPWIPCLTHDGQLTELSLHGFFTHAHELREISCETPLMTAAIYPVVLALLHRVFGPENKRAWRRLIRRGAFSMTEIEAYFEQWYDRFDLFHPEYPFYQQADDRVKPKSIIYLADTIGNTGTLFEHRTPEFDASISPANATRTLIQAQAFRFGGGNSGKKTRNFVDSVFTRGILFFANGKNVFETFSLNLFPYHDDNRIPCTPDDMPVWERDKPFGNRSFTSKDKAYPYGYLDYLTWLTNHYYLIPEETDYGVVVSEFSIAPVLPLEHDSINSHLKSYKFKQISKTKSYWTVLHFDDKRDLWRDYFSLIATTDNNRPPSVVNWLAEIGYEEINLTAFGLLTGSEAAATVFHRQSQLPLPTALLTDYHKQAVINDAIETATTVADRLKFALQVIAEYILHRGTDAKKDKSTINSLIAQWDGLSLYWGELEPHFWQFVFALASDDPDAQSSWYNTLQTTARSSLQAINAMVGTSAIALQAQVIAQRTLNSSLKKVFST